MFWMIICICLFLCCLTEAVLLIRDDGIVARLIEAAKNMAAVHGWRAVIAPAFSFIIGKIRDSSREFGQSSQFSDDVLHIAFCPTGGLGDYIISAKVLEEIQGICACRLDVFCEKEVFGRTVYSSRKDVFLRAYKDFEKSRGSYDLALLVEHFVHVKNYDRKRLSGLSPRLYQKVSYIVDNWDWLYVDIPENYWRERIQFERCRTLGLDRWTELRMGKAFEIADKKVFIPMDRFGMEEWEKSGYAEKTYITMNYGADVMRAGFKQLKMWPKAYFAELVKMLHQEFPNMKAVQLGSSDAECVEGCDKYVFGKSMEQTKWILKNSLVHIDCEGGLVHLATQLGTKCVVIFGPTPVHIYGYAENINLWNKKCSNCMGLHNNWAYQCYRGQEASECMASITPETVFQYLGKICREETI